LIEINPIRKVKHMKLDYRGVVRYLSPAEEDRLYEELGRREGYLPVFVKLLLHTGLRPKEARLLQRNDVDLQRGHITVRSENSKTGNSRHIPLNGTVLPILKAWMQIYNSEYVFPSTDTSAPIKFIQKQWYAVRESAGIVSFRLYDCRHTFASNLAMAGVSIYEIAELLGHSNIEQTKVYAHLAPEYLKAAVNKIA